ncbi:hypothetical protein FFL01_24230 [Flavobacterium flevense]|uniref:Uncharacterized protein n=2 Tax=Flavobacterium flevense TaxID=983 RepID=A0A4Y4B1W9_9FLAO|nr:hypothetical protein FFL01_24230 [Flavobacterium flevense]
MAQGLKNHFVKFYKTMKNILLTVLILIGTISFGQNLKCEDFKKGTFTSEITIPMKMKCILIRNGNEQKEVITEIPDELKDLGLFNKTIYGKIEWIDDCSYRLIYDESKDELNESQKLINSSGGILTEFIKIEGNCIYYKSLAKINGNEQVINGVICKD